MYGVNILILQNGNVWETYSVRTKKCFTCDHAFLDFKKYLKTTVVGPNLVILECESIPKVVESSSNCFRKDLRFVLPSESSNSIINKDVKNTRCYFNEAPESFNNQNTCMKMNGYQLSIILISLISSSMFRKSFIRNIKSMMLHRGGCKATVILELVPPVMEILDYAWGRRMERLAYETLELNAAMSWLSTLGGAFSALGEEKLACAGMAGRISVHQFKIALRLGDLHIVSRCRLYLALSLMQCGKLKLARNIIYNEYSKAKEVPEAAIDIRLLRMCQGLWAKLKYSYVLKYRKRSG